MTDKEEFMILMESRPELRKAALVVLKQQTPPNDGPEMPERKENKHG